MTVQETSQPIEPLTPAELQVAYLLTLDLTYAEIAERTNVAIRTVYYHVGNVIDKLGVRSRVGIVVWYLEQHRKSA
jgi:DNA-binding CsgD family transcriptional regulator